MNFSKYILLTLGLFSMGKLQAQQDVQFSDYRLNISSFNPAFAGFYDGSIMLIHRSQFVGIDGAPESQNLNINAPIDEKMGLGFNVINDKIGVTDELSFTVDYSYSVFLNDDGDMLSFGLKGGFNNINVDYSRLDEADADDALLANNIENRFAPRIGAGILYTNKVWFAGLSTPNFISTNYNATVQQAEASTKPHLYLMTGFQTSLTDELILKPSILAKGVPGAPIAFDIAANFDFRNKFRFGAAYRWDSAITGMVGIQFFENFQAGYAYDHNISDISKFAPSSHQFYLKYTFKRNDQSRRECNCSVTDSGSFLGF
ncbi:type IX secretion system membrane protein PorP/SprF [Flavobacterium sp. NST-5]|uniref:Type IX secretion system membrane protein PorP/SprF n=1 Tax=Flavobacterium ichthyis TaxID=2698827 RepID=A0ABW9Z811_9FLAO|nr:type IX secretion system membrane protein PorP/SprF [Flavobacterium ichthyis]NBL64846.1 type IX secretion system membrane protein PorP/SprF [Flavobacterium ichthyis]